MSLVRLVRPILDVLTARDDVDVIEVIPPPDGRLGVWRQKALAREAKSRGADLIHVFTSAFPLMSDLPVVQTVHEAPWLHGSDENAGLKHRAWAKLGKRFAAATCSPSEGVARDLRPHPHVHVIPWGADPAFHWESDDTDAALRAEHPTLPLTRFVLAPGATRPKKRLESVCAAAVSAELKVVVTGTSTPYVDEVAARFPELVSLGLVDDAFLPALYRRAACVAVLTESEGFALPVIEALRCGIPVVTSRDSVQSDTALGYAIDVDPTDMTDVARGLKDTRDIHMARRVLAAQAASEFSWERTAAGLVTLWASLL